MPKGKGWQELELGVEKTESKVTLRGAGAPRPGSTRMALGCLAGVECAILAAASNPLAAALSGRRSRKGGGRGVGDRGWMGGRMDRRMGEWWVDAVVLLWLLINVVVVVVMVVVVVVAGAVGCLPILSSCSVHAIVAWCMYTTRCIQPIHSLHGRIPASRCVHYITVHSRTCTYQAKPCLLLPLPNRRQTLENWPDMSVISINRASAVATLLPQPHTTHIAHTPPFCPRGCRLAYSFSHHPPFVPCWQPFAVANPSRSPHRSSDCTCRPCFSNVGALSRARQQEPLPKPLASSSLSHLRPPSQAAYWPAALGGVQHNLLLACPTSYLLEP